MIRAFNSQNQIKDLLHKFLNKCESKYNFSCVLLLIILNVLYISYIKTTNKIVDSEDCTGEVVFELSCC